MAPVSIPWSFGGNSGFYTGEVDAGTIPHGPGTIEYSSGPLTGYRYEGSWYAGIKHGHGKLTGANYEHEGSFGSNQPDGHGVRNYKNGRTYDGWWKNGVKEGTGTMTWTSNGWVYSGQWKNDKISGKGTWSCEQGRRTYYSDNWTDDKINGTGFAKYSRGDTYKGRFVNAEKEDTNASYTFPNGTDTYDGGFSQGLFNGQGTLVEGGYKYQGTFVNGKKTGKFRVTNLTTSRVSTQTY